MNIHFFTDKNIRSINKFNWLTNTKSIIIPKQYVPLPNKYQLTTKPIVNYKLLSNPNAIIFIIPIISLVSFLFGYNVGQTTKNK